MRYALYKNWAKVYIKVKVLIPIQMISDFLIFIMKVLQNTFGKSTK